MELTEHEKKYIHSTWNKCYDRVNYIKELLTTEEKRLEFINKVMDEEEESKRERNRLFEKYLQEEKLKTLKAPAVSFPCAGQTSGFARCE